MLDTSCSRPLHRLCALALLLAVAPAQQKISTLFAYDNSGASTWGVFFDVGVLPAGGITITALELNVAELDQGFTIDLFTCPTTYVGYDSNSSAWTRRTTALCYAAGTNGTTVATFTPPLKLAKGSYGFAIYYWGATPLYTVGTGSNQSYSNAHVTMSLGLARSALFAGLQKSPRVWNGSLIYDTTVDPPSFVPWGYGCAGSNGVPTLAASSPPRLGTSLGLSATKLPQAPGNFYVFLGGSRTLWSGLPLPLDLLVLGMPGCKLFVSPDLTLASAHPGGQGIATLPIPNDPSLLGGQAFLQFFVPDAAATSFPARVSNAAQVIIGR